MICQNCGANLPDDAVFCDKCGKRIDQSTPPAQQGQPAQPAQPMQQGPMNQPQMQPMQQGMPMQQGPMMQQGMPMQQGPMMQQGMPMQQGPMMQQGMPMQQGPMMQQGLPMPPQNPKRSKVPVILAIVFGSLFLIAVIIFGAVLLSGRLGGNKKADTTTEESSKSSKKKKETKKEETEEEDTDAEEDEEAEETEEEDPLDVEVSDVNTLTGSSAASYAEMMSTSDRPSESDFSWLEKAYNGGENIESFMEGLGGTKITNPEILNGDWKACFRTKNGMDEIDKKTYRLFNVNIQTSGSDVDLILDWYYYSFGTGETGYEDDYDGKCSGNWNSDFSGFTCNDSELLEMKAFYDKDGGQYAYGEYMYPSGEQEYLILVRPCGPSVPEASNGGGAAKGDGQLSNDEIAALCAKHCGAQYARIDSIESDGSLIVQVYDEVDGHTTTYDWYTVNPKTLDATTEFGFNFNLKDDM